MCVRQRGEDTEPHVRERADREGHPLGDQPGDEPRVLEAANPVIDPLDAQEVERLPDVLGRSFLAGVGHRPEAFRAGPLEDPGELLRRVAGLGGIQAHPGDPRPERERRSSVRHRLAGGQVAEEAEDQLRRDAEAPLALGQRPVETGHDGLERDAPAGVRLGIEEELHVADRLGRDARQVRPGEVVEVLLGDEHAGPGVVEVEEGLEVGELVRPDGSSTDP